MVLHQSLTWFIMRSPHLWKSEPELCGTSPIISLWGFGDCWHWWRAFSNSCLPSFCLTTIIWSIILEQTHLPSLAYTSAELQTPSLLTANSTIFLHHRCVKDAWCVWPSSLAQGCTGSPSSSVPPARLRPPVSQICLWGERQREPAKDTAPPGPINPAGSRLPSSGHKVKELGIKWSKLLGTKDKADRKHKAPTCGPDVKNRPAREDVRYTDETAPLKLALSRVTVATAADEETRGCHYLRR